MGKENIVRENERVLSKFIKRQGSRIKKKIQRERKKEKEREKD